MNLFRKIGSAWRVLREQPRPLREMGRLARRNLRAMRLALSGGRPFTYRLPGGGRFVCLPQSVTSTELFLEPYAELKERDFVFRWLREGDTAWDLGANLGLFSACFAAAVGKRGRVVAVEPGDVAREGLELALDLLGLEQVSVLPNCIWDRSARVNFAAAPGDADVAARVVGVVSAEGSVETITMDEIAVRFPGPALVKMDIEGAEPRALAGASTLLGGSDPPAWMVELYTTGLARMGFGPGDLLRFFPADEYDLYAVNFSHPNPMPEIPVGVVRAVPLPRPDRWPNHSNLLALPRRGRLAERVPRLGDEWLGRR